MEKSYAAGWASDAPTPAQLKEFFAQIASGRVTGKRLQDFLRGIDVTCSERGKGEAPVFSRDMRKEGWTLLEHVQRSITSVSDLELVPVLKKGEDCIDGEEMVRRARVELNANPGQEDAEWLLERQSEIPKDQRNFYLTFPGTLWRDDSSDRCVPCLYWDSGRWYLSFFWLESGWDSGGRLLRPRK
ncbi:MAG: hypothetical protein UY12_C0014G0011 [Parcubacteria group bacterium GW2011_GWA2_47_8b]|uniref:Uncharacterized protein n=3 Tax=Parcubacteria group TaxID=1794811 RepID=A0A0G1NDA5_9BACT|nr:MAG: hypothetical protein UW78_C0002G0040 [Candidatus Azambacteria bacterium GW2011_GWA1_44_9]KKU76582.1 MAG: hypothetical protein UY02_C0017G0004 [Candidatus Giovannonibacteria bacterium GW2011_GWB1_47_6b]KKU85001.1 MAG: hypothetical protein UY12_C0014G0011 [Parcubacteria group bacterium GW2011_GWA2_47_8b]OGY65125.1 MAG: hypothetical protein A3E64_01580 [Candidatus Harrisonbacteria bacterium RIFCSPHIGHO2_12_FULL_48_16]